MRSDPARTLTTCLTIALLLAPTAAAATLPPVAAEGPVGCSTTELACGAAEVVNSCFSWGAGAAAGVSADPDTVWTFRFSRSSSVKGYYAHTETRTGPVAEFEHEDPDRSLWTGDVYGLTVSLSADGERVAYQSLACA